MTYQQQSEALENDMPALRRGGSELKNQWRHAYNEAVRSGPVVLMDIRTRQMVTPWRG